MDSDYICLWFINTLQLKKLPVVLKKSTKRKNRILQKFITHPPLKPIFIQIHAISFNKQANLPQMTLKLDWKSKFQGRKSNISSEYAPINSHMASLLCVFFLTARMNSDDSSPNNDNHNLVSILQFFYFIYFWSTERGKKLIFQLKLQFMLKRKKKQIYIINGGYCMENPSAKKTELTFSIE